MASEQPEFGRTARPALVGAVLVVVVFGGIAGLRELGLLQIGELAAYDILLARSPGRPNEHGPVALVQITESDIQDLGKWPLSDDMLAKLLQRIAAQGPQVIGLDIYRDQAVPPGGRALEHALVEHNVVGIEKFGGDDTRAVPPPPVLAGGARVGFSDMVIDPDGVVRRGLLFLDDGREVHYALSLRLALDYLGARRIHPRPGERNPEHLRLGDVTIRPFESNDGGYVGADAGGYQYLLDYRDDARSIPRVSFGDVMTDAPAADALADKIVVVGVAAESVADYFSVPAGLAADGGPIITGMELHARMASQLVRAALRGHGPPAVLPDTAEYAWLLLWVLGGVLVGLRMRSLARFASVLATGLLALVLSGYTAFLWGYWIPILPVTLGWLGAAGLMTAFMSSYEKHQRLFLMDLFSRHVSPDVAEEIWRQRERFLSGGRPESRKTTATILFSDLQDFTPISERLGPVALMDWLNRYLDRMAGIVMKHGGVVDDYYGDAIKANFGVPLGGGSPEEVAADGVHAVRCALGMREEMGRLNRELTEQDLPLVRMRVGICTGPVVAGCLGSARRMKYTTVGDTVNIAARLESYGKDLPADVAAEHTCRIMLAESTVSRLDGQYSLKRVGNLALKGKSEPVAVYSLLGETKPEPQETGRTTP